MELVSLNNSIVIANHNTQKDILKQMSYEKQLINIKLITLDDIYDEITFKITKKLIYYVVKNYNVIYNVALKYLQSLKEVFLIELIDETNKKIKFLKDLKEDLINNSLIEIKKDKVINYYKNKRIVLINDCFIDKKYNYFLKEFTNLEICEEKKLDFKKLVVHEFNSIEKEINYTIERIMDLLNKNVDINKIVLFVSTNDYYFLLKTFFKMYNIPLIIKNEKSLYDLSIIKDLIKDINDNTLEKIKNNPEVYNKVIEVLNNYSFTSSYDLVKEGITEGFKKTYINRKYIDAIRIEDFYDYSVKEDEYVFLLGFLSSAYPRSYNDIEYLSDLDKQNLNLSKTIEKNAYYLNYTKTKLMSINNLHLSYAKKASFVEYIPSTLIKDLKMDVISDEENHISFLFSNEYNKYELGCKLDDYINYKFTSKDLYKLNNTYKSFRYRDFDNTFKEINHDMFIKLINNKVNLSYSSLDDYNKCAFSYYLKRILKLNIFEDSLSQKIGNLFHEVLSVSFTKSFDFERDFEKSKEKYFVNRTSKEDFLLIRLKKELIDVIDYIRNQKQYMNYDKEMYEKEVRNINVTSNITFEGKIDKIIYKVVDDQTYLVVVDYKTGKIDPSIELIKYGLHLQLPSYIYIINHSKLFKNPFVTGFYYQNILQEEFNAKNATIYQNKKDAYKLLQGYTVELNDESIKFDNTENDSKLIKSLGKRKDNSFSAYSKVLDVTMINKLNNYVEESIKKAGENILNRRFDINPIAIGGKNKSCEFCKFSDICFRKKQNERNYGLIKDLTFLDSYTK